MVENMLKEEELQAIYRKYTQAKMLECIEDAKNILEQSFGSDKPDIDRVAILLIARELFNKRVSPYHYWKEKRLVRVM